MADNGNRGPNDFRSRGGKKRREPPIIDASATEVPIDSATPAADETSGLNEADAPRSDRSEDAIGGEPVLFGSAMRDVSSREFGGSGGIPAAGEPPRAVETPSDATPRPSHSSDPAADLAGTPADPLTSGEPIAPAEPAAPAEPVASGEPVAPAERDAAAPGAADDPVTSRPFSDDSPSLRRDAAVPAPPPARSAGLASLLGVACLALLCIIAWLLYAGPRRAEQDAVAASVADLKSKVAALEARPDPAGAQSQVQGSVAALDKRLTAADADRAALAKSVAGLTGRLDAVAEQAQGAAASADKATAALTAKPDAAGGSGDATPVPAFATLGAVAALSAKVDDLDKNLTALSDDQGRTAKTVADLPKPVAPDFAPVDAKVAALDARVTTVDGKLNASDARFNGFDAKVNGVEGKVNGFDARMNALDGRVNAIESKADDAVAQGAKLQATVANLPKVDLSPLLATEAALDGRVAKMESQLAAPKDGTRQTEARAVGSADETKATPIALVGQAIEDAIADGRPYGADLDALKALGAEPDAVAKLSPLAAKGAPTAPVLKERWEAVEGDVLAVLKPPSDAGTGGGSVLSRFAASARNLVQVRRVGAVAGGDDASAIVLEVDAALNSGDVSGALAAWSRLPAAAQDKSRDWAALANAQRDASVAAQDLVGRAIATLGRTKS